jgi:hypothetical protein
MKKNIALVCTIIIIVALFSSCKKGDTNPIVGKWNANKTVTVHYQNGILMDKDTSLYDENKKGVINFASNGTGTTFYTEGGVDETSNFTYKATGDKLNIYHDGDTSIYNTNFINNNELNLSQTYESEQQDIIYKWEYTIFLTRQ